MRTIYWLRRAGLFGLWGLWWGGLTFYAAVVVPLGTEIWGSTEQGFLTQRVTPWLHAFGALLAVCLLAEAIPTCRRGLAGIAVALAVVTGALTVWHARLSGLMEAADRSVGDGFYAEHAVYLWLTTTAWLLGWGILGCLVSGEAAGSLLERRTSSDQVKSERNS
jgi:hypothetical protein